MIKVDLLPVWHEKEKRLGGKLSITDVAKGAGVNWKTVYNLLEGETGRFDSEPIAKLCQYFDVTEGEPIPFLRVTYENSEKQGQ